MRHPIFLTKLILTAAAAVAAAAFIVHQVQTGKFSFEQPGYLLMQTSHYRWPVPLDSFLLAKWTGAAVVLAGLIWARRRRRWAGPGWLGPVVAWLLFSGASALVITEWLGSRTFEPVLILLPAVLAALVVRYGLITNGRATWLVRVCAGVNRLGIRPLALFFGMVGAGVGLFSWWKIFDTLPLISDSQSQISQARLLATGHLTLNISQALRDVIGFPASVTTVPSYTQYPPGHILLLVPVVSLRLPPQFLNIIASAGTAVFCVLTAVRLGGRAAGVIAGILLTCSPFFLVMSGEVMNHSTTALMLTAAVWAFLPAPGDRGGTNRSRWRQAFGGFALGWALMTRPLTATAHGLVWAVVWALEGAGNAAGFRRVGQRALVAAAGFTLPFVIFLFYNFMTTGHPLRLGYQTHNPEFHRLGFRADGPFPFTPADALGNTVASIISLESLMFGWATGSSVLLLAWWTGTRLRRGEVILLALIVSQTGAYMFYHFHDLILGPRFLYELLPLFSILAALGLAPAIRRNGRVGTVVLLLVLVMAAGAVGDGFGFWKPKIAQHLIASYEFDRLIRPHLPVKRPTVFVINPVQEEMAGRFFPPLPGEQPRWFVHRTKEEEARRLPELRGYEWIRFPLERRN